VQDILNLLQIDKNILGNIELITMSNLRFILMTAYVEDKYRVQLDYLLRVALNINDDKEIQIYVDEHSEKNINWQEAYRNTWTCNFGRSFCPRN
jgi:hypothetical protein